MDYSDVFVDQAWLVGIRRELHMHPELGWDLPMTTALVRRELDKMGVAYEFEKYGKNTVVATINPHITGFTIGIRADMDALPIEEENHDKPYRSQHEGMMHACGHDTHTTMLLGAARALNELKDHLHCRVKLLFQPCEESRPSGARTMCEHGVMDDIDCIIMCHVNCNDPVHVPSCRDGVTNSTSSRFQVKFHGRSVHVALPHKGVDALAMGMKMYMGIQMLISRELDPFDTCVMTVTTLNAGNTVSTNADLCDMMGNIRALSDQTMVWARKRIDQLAHSIADEMGGTCEVDFFGDALPRCINNSAMYHAFIQSSEKVLGKGGVAELLPTTGAEDFAYYEQRRPGLLFGLGMRNEDKGCVHPAHTKDWDVDEDALQTGVKLFVQFVLDNMDGVPGL